MLISAWPFLVGRNRTLGYKPLVAPQFLLDESMADLVSRAVRGEVNEPDQAIYREIHGAPVGELSLVFRLVWAEARFIGLNRDEVLQDQYGRPIILAEGMVVRGFLQNIVATEDDFALIHKQTKQVYREFWSDTRDTFVTKPSEYFSLHKQGKTNKSLSLLKEPPLHIEKEIKTQERDTRISPKGAYTADKSSFSVLPVSEWGGSQLSSEQVPKAHTDSDDMKSRPSTRWVYLVGLVAVLIVIQAIVLLIILSRIH